jgi:hypothetical protein
MSDRLDGCPVNGVYAGDDCSDLCEPGEYGLSCGPPFPNPLAPPGCRDLPLNPGGSLQWSCCPCGEPLINIDAGTGAGASGSGGAGGGSAVVAKDARCDPLSSPTECVTEGGSSLPCRCPTPLTTTAGLDAAYKAYADAGCLPAGGVTCSCPAQFAPPYACSADGVCTWGGKTR